MLLQVLTVAGRVRGVTLAACALVMVLPAPASAHQEDGASTAELAAAWTQWADPLVAATDNDALALDIANAIARDPGQVTGASFATIPAATNPPKPPNGVSTTAAGSFGGSYGVLTTGRLSDAYGPPAGNTSTSHSWSTVRGNTSYDVSVLKIDLAVPDTANCLWVRFAYHTEEYPEFVGKRFNDAFIAELDESTWTTSGSTISAPGNFAFDPEGKVVSVNSTGATSMSAANAAGTAYDGGTVLLAAAVPVTPGAHSAYFSVLDQGDPIYDSAVFLDDLALENVPEGTCTRGARLEPPSQGLTATKTADAETVAPGAVDGYTITFTNPNAAAVSIASITDTLPSGFTYTAGTSTIDGVAAADPAPGDPLTWTGPFSVPGNGGSVSLHFDVTAATTPGEYFNTAGALDDASATIATTGPTAKVVVTGNNPPVALDQEVTTLVDMPVPIRLGATDADGSDLQFTVITPPDPEKGTLSGTGRDLTFTPKPGFVGDTFFTFQVHDGTDPSNVATVPIHVIDSCAPTASQPGGIFISGHDAEAHAAAGTPNEEGAIHIVQRAIAWTSSKASPRVLLIATSTNTDPGPPPGRPDADPRVGLTKAGFTFAVAHAAPAEPGALDLGTVKFGDYDVVVIASDPAGWLTQAESDTLAARSSELLQFVNSGGGLVAFSEALAKNPFGFLPFVVSAVPSDFSESGITLEQLGVDMGLTVTDVNGNVSHNVFKSTSGLGVVDRDATGRILSLAARGKRVDVDGLCSSDRIRNGHFERPVLSGFHVTRRGTELDHWTVEGDGIDHIPQELWPAAEGRQSIDLNAEGPGSVWQDVATEPGARYTLRFSMAANMTCGDAVREMAVSWNGTQVAVERFDGAGHTPQDPGWEERSVAVQASGEATSRVKFESLAAQSACGPALDFVRLEPAGAPPAAKLTVLRDDEAGGNVTSGDEPKTIDCGATCSATYPDGTEVVLNPTPKPGWKFTGWDGAVCAGSLPQCTLTMIGDRTITAKFERITHELHVKRLGNGTGTVESVDDTRIACGDTCDAPYDQGSSVTLRATPEAGHRFIGWHGGGCSGNADCTVTIDAEKTVEAIFVKSGPLTWSLARDFRTSFDKPEANPIPDTNGIPAVWSLGYSDLGDLDAVREPSRYNLLGQRKTDANQTLSWSTPGNLGTEISMTEDPVKYGWPHIVQVEPYGDRLQVVGWRSPITGHVRVEGGLTGAPGGDGVRWFITRAAAELARGEVAGGNCETQSFADGTGGASLAEIPVTAGETLYFVIDPRGPGGTNEGSDIPALDVNISEVAEGTPPPVSGRWELAHDMRRAPIQQNDNLDSYGYACAWAFERGEGVSHDAPTRRLVTMTPALAGIAGLEGWTGQYDGAVNLLYPLVGMNTGVEFDYEGFTVPSGRVLIHPAPEHTAIVRWRSPFTGYVRVTGAATDLDPDSGDGVLWTIDRNSTTLADGAVHNSSQAFGDGALAAVPVSKGDTLAFIVAPGEAGYFDDTTQLDIVIERIPAPPRILKVILDPADDEGGGVTSGDDPKTIDCLTLCEASYPDGTEVELTAAAKPGWRFVRWEGDCSGDGECTVAMTEPRTVTAIFERVQHALTVEIQKVNEGSGRVDSEEPGIDCGPACVKGYPHATSVTLRHHAAAGSRFIGWIGCGTLADPLGDCVVEIDGPRKLIAQFQKLVRLTVTVEGGEGTVSATPGGIGACALICHADYEPGTPVSVEAKPAAGWRFVRYSAGPCGTDPKCDLKMDADTTVTARFERVDPPRDLFVDVIPANAGRVKSDPAGVNCLISCRATYANGVPVKLTAEALPGYRFKQLSGAGCIPTGQECTVTMNTTRFVNAEFERVGGPLKMSLGVSGQKGSVLVTPPGTKCVSSTIPWGTRFCPYQFAANTKVVLVAKPEAGHRFTEWTLGPCQYKRDKKTGAAIPRCEFIITPALLKGSARLAVDARFDPIKPAKPAVGKTSLTTPLSGTVTYRPPSTAGAAQAADGPHEAPFVPIDGRRIIPMGSTIDATRGALRLTIRNARGRFESIDLRGGMFDFRQAARGAKRGRTTLTLTTAEPNPCATGDPKRALQRLTAKGGGAFFIRTRFSESAAKRATWTTEDGCDRTTTKVTRGTATVRDLARKKTLRLRAGRSLTVRPRGP